MQIVIDHCGAHRELDLEIEDPHACVADLVSAVDADLAATGAGVVIEGRLFGPDIGLDEIGLYEGAVLAIAHEAAQSVELPHGPALAIVGGPVAGTLHRLDGRPVVIGRHQSCDVALADPTVSTHHARLEHDGDGLVVTDLGSHNGTWIDGRAVTGPTATGRTAW